MNSSTWPAGCTNAKVRKLMRRIDQHYDGEVAQTGLRTTQYSLLTNLAHTGPIRPVDLAARMGMTASTLSRNVQPLVAAGWVTAGAGPDARSRLLHLTDEGLAKRREAQLHWKLAQQRLAARLGADRVAALHTLIDESLALLGSGPVLDDES